MILKHSDIINAPLDRVYDIVKNDLAKVAQYLPSVQEIKVLEYTQQENGKVYIVNQWVGKANIPDLAKRFVNESLLSWKDLAHWDDKLYRVDYEIESFFAKDIYEAKGTNDFKAHDQDKTKLTLNCEVHIHPENIPGIPRFIAKQLHPMLEKMIEKMLAPNLTSLGNGLKEFLRAEKTARLH